MKVQIAPTYEDNGNRFRIYEEDPKDRIQERVKKHYTNQHLLQTVQFVKDKHKEWLSFSHAKMGVLECLDVLSGFLDESDPDVDEPNLVHAYQTAERLRAAHPDKPWMHLAGLVHDLGKVMGMWGEQQWAITGDTYPVGCAPSETIVYGAKSFVGNTDQENPAYNTTLGMYEEHCGLENLLMTWGHDEYIYQVLKNHGTSLPEEALYAIRFHSFYPYHSHGAYRQFSNERDDRLYPYIAALNSCDLYSKQDSVPDLVALRGYYQTLVDQYIPGIVSW